jgi:glycosyltransferase involved in cell wall biosynthesis
MQKTSFAWELIIADDCSTDGTVDILRSYKKLHPGLITVIERSKNIGPEKNWLDLLNHAKSKYVLYAEGDDYFTDSEKLQIQVDFLEAHKKMSACFHPVKVKYDDNSKSEEIFPSPDFRFNKAELVVEDLLKRNFIQTNSIMYRWRFVKESIDTVYPKGISPGDWFLHLLHAETGAIGFIDRTMAVYRRHSNGMWWNADKNVDLIWIKHGHGHMAFYKALLDYYGTTPERKKIINSHIHTLLNNFFRIDTKDHSKLFADALAKYPQIAANHAWYLEEQLKNEIETRTSHEETIKQLEQTLEQRDWHLRQKDIEIARIKSSRIWKVRNKIARILGKPIV